MFVKFQTDETMVKPKIVAKLTLIPKLAFSRTSESKLSLKNFLMHM